MADIHTVSSWLLPDLPRRHRSGFASFVIALALVGIAAFASRPLLRRSGPARIGGLAGSQLEAAANWVFCGRYVQGTSGNEDSRRKLNLAEIRNPSDYSQSPLD